MIYGNAAIIPCPHVSIANEPIIGGNQKRLGNTYKFTITGTLIVYKGSPASVVGGAGWGGYNNQFWTLSGYPPDETNPSMSLHQLYMAESKIAALQGLFATEGQWLEIQSADGSQPMKVQPKNIIISIAEGIWFTEIPYTITFDADVIYLNGIVYQGLPYTDLIQQATESWSFTPGEIVKTFSITHEVSAVGKRAFDVLGNESIPAWQAAKNFVYNQLVLGISGISTLSIAGGSIFNQSSLGSGVINLFQYKQYNQSRTENVDEIGGSFSVTENWTAATASGAETYVVSTRRIVEDPYTTITATVQGTIKGFYDGLFNYDQRLPAAQYLYSQLAAPTGLLPRVTAFAGTGYSFNIQPTQSTIDYNQNEGSLSYAVEFSNRLFEMDSYEQYAVNRKTSVEDYKSTFTINGSIKGRRYDGDVDPTIGYQRALAQWQLVNSGTVLHDRITSSKYFPTFSGLQLSPISFDIDYNEGDGLVTYAYSFNNRINDYNGSNDVNEEYQISKHFSVDDGITTYSLQGTVQGLNITDTNPRGAKYTAASGYYFNYVEPNAYSRVKQYFGVNLPNPNALVTEVAHFPVLGQITYTFEFRNTFPPILPGVLSEHITVSETNPDETVNVIGKVGIIGRPKGPILQDMATTTEKTRSITVEAVLTPTGGSNLLACFNTKPDYTLYIFQLKPVSSYTEQDGDNWDWKNARYTRTVSWTYE